MKTKQQIIKSLPRYYDAKHNRDIHAAKITFGITTTDGRVILTLDTGDAIEVSRAYDEEHSPQIGGYYAALDTGEDTYIRPDAFGWGDGPAEPFITTPATDPAEDDRPPDPAEDLSLIEFCPRLKLAQYTAHVGITAAKIVAIIPQIDRNGTLIGDVLEFETGEKTLITPEFLAKFEHIERGDYYIVPDAAPESPYIVTGADFTANTTPINGCPPSHSTCKDDDTLWFPFAAALHALEHGKRTLRNEWKPEEIWLKLQRPDEHSKMTLPYIYIECANGTRVPWAPSQTDLFSADWIILPN